MQLALIAGNPHIRLDLDLDVDAMLLGASCPQHGESDSIQLDTYFVYPEELKTVARVQVFRDFVVSKAQRWPA